MTPQQIIEILIEIRSLLIAEIKQHRVTFDSGLCLQTDYPIIRYTDDMLRQAHTDHPCDVYGLTMIRVNQWLPTKGGRRIAGTRTVDFLAIRIDNTLSILAIIHTFLHELAHTVTMPEQHKSSQVSRKLKKIQPMVDNSR